MKAMDRRRVSRRTLLGAALAVGSLPMLGVATARAGDDEGDVPVAIPTDIASDEPWVDVNLSWQAAVAMVGTDALRVAWATTGMDGWETPEGEFRIVRRVYNETMTSAALGIPPGPDSYVLTDVLFTQYFTWEGHALHLNYWRPNSVFGHERTSHGCVGLRYDDAAFLWQHVGYGNRVVIHS